MTKEKLLFICAANLCRSPTAEHLTQQAGYTAKSAGLYKQSIQPITNELCQWADKIIVMEQYMKDVLTGKIKEKGTLKTNPVEHTKITVLNIPDIYEYGNPTLIKRLKWKLYQTGIDTTKTQFEPQQKYYLPFNYPPYYYITLDTVHALIGICENHNDCIVVYFPDGDCEFHTGTKADRRYLIDEIESML